MAATTCGNCGSHAFEVGLLTPLRRSMKLQAVQCSACGVPVAVIDPGSEARLDALRLQIASVDERMARIAKALTG